MPILWEPEEVWEPVYPDPSLPRAAGPRKEPPEIAGYRLVAHERIPITRVSVIGLLSAPLWLAVFLLVRAALGGPAGLTIRITLSGTVLGLLILLLVVPFLHEAIHGLAARALGARPSYGVGAGFAYTTFLEPVGWLIYLSIGLAPLLVLTLLGILVLLILPGASGLTLVFLVGNASGAMGDLWVANRLRAVRRDALIVDLADGFAWYVPEALTPGPSPNPGRGEKV